MNVIKLTGTHDRGLTLLCHFHHDDKLVEDSPMDEVQKVYIITCAHYEKEDIDFKEK